MLDAAQTRFKRATAFLADAKRAPSPEDRSRFLAAAVESAVAIVEGFLSQARDAEKVRQLAWSTLPRYRLLKRVRIHDFHRRPLPSFPPELTSTVKVVYTQGPFSLSTGTAANSSAAVTVGPQGLQCYTSGSGTVDRTPGGRDKEKELCVIDGQLVDEFTGDRVSLEQALEEYLGKVPEFLAAVNTV